MALVVEIADLALAVFVANRTVGLAAVGELGGQDRAIAQFLAVQIVLFVQDAELVAGTDLQREIDVPAEDLGQFHDLRIRQARLLPVGEQRGLDQAGRRGKLPVDILVDLFDVDRVIADRYDQAIDLAALQLQTGELPIRVELEAQGLSGPDVGQLFGLLVGVDDAVQQSRL